MSDLISREDAINAMMVLKQADDLAYGCEIPESFDSERAIEALKNIPSAYPEIITIEELSNLLGSSTIQSAFYWFEFLKTLDSLGFAIVRKEKR